MPNKSVSGNGQFVSTIHKNTKKISSKIKTDIKQQIKEIQNGQKSSSAIANILLDGLLFSFTKLFQFLSSTLVNKTLVNNVILRKLESKYSELKNDDKKFIEWIKKHPTISSYVSYYLGIFITCMIIHWSIGINNTNTISKKQDTKDNSGKTKTEKVDNLKQDNDQNAKIYDLTSKTFAEDFYQENKSLITIWLLEMETYRETPTVHCGENRHTYGPGLTWVYTSNGKKGYIQNACNNEYVTMAKDFTDNEIWEQVHRHMIHPGQGLRILQKRCKDYKIQNLNSNQIMGLLIASYQMPADINKIVQGIANAKGNKQQELDAFSNYSGRKNCEEGTLKRRWWAAACYFGYITSDEVLQLHRDGFSKVNINSIIRNGQFKMDSNTIEYAKIKTSEKQTSTVYEFIIEHKLNVQANTKNKTTIHYNDEKPDLAMKEITTALKAYNQGNYTIAIEHYKKAVNLDPDNIEAYSSMAIAYKNLGDDYKEHNNVKKAKECYEKCCEYVQIGNKRMNDNSSLLEDHEQKANLYYNAGKAREAIAIIYAQQGDLQSAIQQYALASTNYNTCIANAAKVNYEDGFKKDVYQNAKMRADQQKEKYQKQLNAKKSNETGTKQGFSKGKTKLAQVVMQSQNNKQLMQQIHDRQKA